MSRTNIPVSDAVYDRLADHKAEGETWDDVLEQAADALDEEPGSEQTACITPEQVAEIARETAAEVENRMTRR
ncbi:hypothetical protein BDK61_2642 [Haloarcula quadrata]|uniref:Uncharacterized protein n=1 Tax=Haloarcula quadrata TaxID=182779 RepID=A0A495R7S5_9EURY|nr:hypothetical protein [Haloarcula quadrata]RKS83299.1 hypothetical protein BDK61_2642 [Haloarcula quadrata]